MVERSTIRCPHCELNQFITKNGECRRCKRAFVEPEKPADDLVAIEVVRPRTATWDERVFAPLLRLLRGAQGLSQRQLALRLGVPRTYVSKLENSHCLPTMDSLHAIAAALGITTQGLMLMYDTAARGGYKPLVPAVPQTIPLGEEYSASNYVSIC